MSERAFRAVVASVLVGALALAVIVASTIFLLRSPGPSPSASVANSTAFGPTGTPAPTPIPVPVFAATDVIGVGQIPRGGASGKTLVLHFLESSLDAIPNAAGSFQVTLTDHAGDGTTVAFVGTPSVAAPGSLGATARLVAANVLLVSIAGSDTRNVEPISISGLGVSASATAAIGSVNAAVADFTGSLASGIASTVVASPGTVIASP
jgi:hypothetical protein